MKYRCPRWSICDHRTCKGTRPHPHWRPHEWRASCDGGCTYGHIKCEPIEAIATRRFSLKRFMEGEPLAREHEEALRKALRRRAK